MTDSPETSDLSARRVAEQRNVVVRTLVTAYDDKATPGGITPEVLATACLEHGAAVLRESAGRNALISMLRTLENDAFVSSRK